MIKLTADLIFINQSFVTDLVVILDDDGTILKIDSLSEHDKSTVKSFDGALLPGFINTHCHLELSHMKGLVPTGTTLLPFLKSVVKFRDFPEDEIMNAISSGDKEMYENGIVAVGDISNKLDTSKVKSNSKIDYYTFVEMFDFMSPAMTEATIAQYKPVMDGQSVQRLNKKSFVPHAPYTVSPELFAFIKKTNPDECTVSIHNQETVHENDLFVSGKGGFIEFFGSFGIDMSQFIPNEKTSIHYAMENMNPKNKVLMVHNTLTTAEDIEAAISWNEKVYWASCPNANLYIENRLPNYQLFLDKKVNVTLGTDSLTSNWQLSIWEELKTINKYCSYVPLELLITWATINGAKALSYDDRLGSISIGKKPGIVQVPIIKSADSYIIENGEIKRVI